MSWMSLDVSDSETGREGCQGESMTKIQDGGRVIFSPLAGLSASELSETAPRDRLSGWVRAPAMCRDLLANVS